MLERLFSSRVRVKLLALLLLNPGRSFHIRQLARQLEASYSNVRRELQNLTELGLLNVKTVANTTHFSANQSHFLYHDLRSILLKTEGIGDALRERLAEVGNIQLALVYGSTARDRERADSDIDLLIVGQPDPAQLEAVLDEVETRLGRPVNYTLYTPVEWENKLMAQDPFLRRVMAGEQIPVLGEDGKHPRSGAAGAR